METVQNNKEKPGGNKIDINAISFECNEKEGVKVLAGVGDSKSISDVLKTGMEISVEKHNFNFNEKYGTANRELNGVVRPVANKGKAKEIRDTRKKQGRKINIGKERDDIR